MREVNKDLKLHFSQLQQRINELEARDRDHGFYAGESSNARNMQHRRQPSKRNRRYDSSEEEEEAERHKSNERPVGASGQTAHANLH